MSDLTFKDFVNLDVDKNYLTDYNIDLNNAEYVDFANSDSFNINSPYISIFSFNIKCNKNLAF